MSRLLSHYSKSRTAFVCIDLQAAFESRIANFPNCVFVANRFAQLHTILADTGNSKYIITEQYPKGLGTTTPAIEVPAGAVKFEKTRFSCVTDEFAAAVKECDTVVLFGIEAHVCVLQTAAELMDLQKRVVLPVDGLGSQKQTDMKRAIRLMTTWGNGNYNSNNSGGDCILSTSESIVFQMMKDAKDPKFKQVSKLMQQTHPIAI